jgi:hypothetical protein
MPSKYASGKYSIAECDRCGFRYKLKELKKEVVKTKLFQIKVCPSCWNPDQPQLQLGMYPVNDPQAVREPRPDVSYYAAGATGLYTSDVASNDVENAGYPTDGSRQFQWNWNPVGGANDYGLTPNDLVLPIQIGTVTVQTT